MWHAAICKEVDTVSHHTVTLHIVILTFVRQKALGEEATLPARRPAPLQGDARVLDLNVGLHPDNPRVLGRHHPERRAQLVPLEEIELVIALGLAGARAHLRHCLARAFVPPPGVRLGDSFSAARG